MTEQDRLTEAEELVNCVAAVFKVLKSRDPAGSPWVGNMLATEHLRQMGTSIYIQLNRRGSSPPPAPTEAAAVPKKGKVKDENEKIPVVTFTCAQCDETKVWRPTGKAAGKAPWPGAVCLDCWKEAHP